MIATRKRLIPEKHAPHGRPGVDPRQTGGARAIQNARVVQDTDCVALLQWALPRPGLCWPGFRKVRRQVCKRISRRMRELGLADAAAYRDRLESDAAEWQALAALGTIPTSRFYRDREVFDALGESVLPALAAAARERGARRLECWSAGCASGEEPYTLAIQWRMALAARFPAIDLHVFGTDVDARLLERARAACHRPGSLSALPAAWQEPAFEPRGNLLCLRQAFRDTVALECQDLLAVLPRRQFDVVLCATSPSPISTPGARALRSSASRAGCATAARWSSASSSACRSPLPASSPGRAAARFSGCERVDPRQRAFP
jgi:chemotaxis protein methyltransferase CheR